MIPDFAWPSGCERTSRPLTPSRIGSFIGGTSFVITGIPKAIASYSGRPRPSQRLIARHASQFANRSR